jgi:hypothetical protein
MWEIDPQILTSLAHYNIYTLYWMHTFEKFLYASLHSAMSVRHALVAKMCNLFVSIILTFTKIL